ncbi:hypothetical protein HF086_007178 [Spodoptera exigua]|uniref:Uncharacterized protein n=1 Tax=Spodoptera exigua TaxID=7107 RepID=A0A922SFT9_SPOEX|nr:hypothetical protein HF086_007178 [Spodoptera exigua]
MYIVYDAGKPTGTAQRLIETQLKPGVADWNIVVPMPPACENAEVTGVDLTVCDADAAPEVTMSNALTARVHRTGQLTNFAAVNVTVHCNPSVLTTSSAPVTTPTISTPPVPTTPSATTPATDARSTYEMFSEELISKVETPLNYSANDGLTSNELTPPTTASTTTSPPLPEVTTRRLETTSTTELVTTTQKKKIRPKLKKPRTVKVTIKIAPIQHDSRENDIILSSDGPESLSNKQKPDQQFSLQSSEYPSYMETPPRIGINPPIHHERPHRPESPSLHYGAQFGPQYGPQYGAQLEPQQGLPEPLHWLAAQPPPYSAYNWLYSALMSPYSVLGSSRLFGPRRLYWLRHKPTMILSNFK